MKTTVLNTALTALTALSLASAVGAFESRAIAVDFLAFAVKSSF